MSWFEGVTEVREKLQGAFTEVGLPAYDRKSNTDRLISRHIVSTSAHVLKTLHLRCVTG